MAGASGPFFRRLRGDLVRWASPRAHTIPGSLLAAVSGSWPHQRLRRLTRYPMRRARVTCVYARARGSVGAGWWRGRGHVGVGVTARDQWGGVVGPESV